MTESRKRKRDEDAHEGKRVLESKVESLVLAEDEREEDVCGAMDGDRPCQEPKANAAYNPDTHVWQCPGCYCEVRRAMVDDDSAPLLDASGAAISVVPGSVMILDHRRDQELLEDRRLADLNEGYALGAASLRQDGLAFVPLAPAKKETHLVFDALARELQLPTLAQQTAQQLWDSLKDAEYFQRIQKPKAMKVVLLSLACKRSGTPRPMAAFHKVTGVKKEDLKRATESLVRRGFNMAYSRLRAIQGYVDYFLFLHLKRDPQADESPEQRLVSEAHRWCSIYVSRCELATDDADAKSVVALLEAEDDVGAKFHRKHETTIAATALLVAHSNDEKLAAAFQSTLTMKAVSDLTGVTTKSLHACLADLAAVVPSFKGYQRAPAPHKKTAGSLRRGVVKGKG